MALRPAHTVRDLNKPAWTRKSKVQSKNYVKSVPHMHLNMYRMGDKNKEYDTIVKLVSKEDVVVRDNALEAARQSANKHLEKTIPGKYYFVIRVYPHHVIRENRMLAGAGADRLQQGMRRAFGRPTSNAARIFKGTEVFTIYVNRENVKVIKEALKKASIKMSGKYAIETVELKEAETPTI